MDHLFHLLGIQLDWRLMFLVGSLIFVRMLMITTTIPFLTGKPVPAPVKVGVALSFLVFLYPYLAPSNPKLAEVSPILMFLLYLKELGIGISIGFAASIVFYGFEAAGAMIDNQRGAAQARLLIPQFGQESSVFGQFLYLLGVVLFLSIGGHLLFIKAIVKSYELFPILTVPQAAPDLIGLVDQFVHLTGTVLMLGLQLCAPVLISIFIADVILGVISKTAPAINVWEMGFVLRGVVGVLVVFLSIGLMATQMEKISLTAVEAVDKIISFLARS